MQASVSEFIRQDKHCVVMSIKVLVALQFIHNCKVSFKPFDTWALPAYFVEISPNNSNDHVLIMGAHASAFVETKLQRTMCISVTTASSLSGTGNNSPVAISV